MEGFYTENGVSNFSICARCGQAIKNLFDYRGKVYGSECIKHVTGELVDYWVMKGNRIDEDATAKRNAACEASRLLAAAEKADREALAARCVVENSWLIDALKWGGEFCESMCQLLSEVELNDKNFSPRMLQIMRDVYAKGFGRGNSKKYWAATDDFDAKVRWSE